jgi:transposase
MDPNRSSRRVHSAEFKRQVLAECRQPGASVSAVAIAHGLNTNVVRKLRISAHRGRHFRLIVDGISA